MDNVASNADDAMSAAEMNTDMQSSRPSPPISGQNSPTKALFELTPRAKIRALLAEVSSDSDDEEPVTTAKKPTRPSTKPAALPATVTQKPLSRSAAGNDTEDDEEDAPIRPKGRMAARMLGASEEQSDKSDAEDAYERVKRQLMSAQEKRVQRAQQQSRRSPEADSEDDDIPTRARRAKTPVLSRVSAVGSPMSRRSSPGLFVSPSPSKRRDADVSNAGSDSDSDVPAIGSTKFQELVRQKRAERKAREEAERKEAEERRKRLQEAEEIVDEDDEVSDENVEKRLTQKGRVRRGATKKALEEMRRVQQKIQRDQQLAHQAKTKKKYTTKDLFARFNFRQPAKEEPPKESSQSSDRPLSVGSAVASSDVEANNARETPPTSPPSDDGPTPKPAAPQFPAVPVIDEESDGELPDINGPIPQRPKLDKGKQRAISVEPNVTTVAHASVPAASVPPKHADSDTDDDDLEIIPPSRIKAFDNLPVRRAEEPRSIRTLRVLAHLTSPSKTTKPGEKNMNPAQLAVYLQRRAREQIQREKQEKIEELRRRGIHIQTEEEREQELLELDNLLEKARKEDEELTRREREAAKKEGGEVDALPSEDEDEDEDYVGSEEEVEVELSGSEEDGEDDEEEEEGNEMVDEAAEEGEDGEAENAGDADEERGQEQSEDEAAPARARHARRSRHVVADDEDEEEEKEVADKSTSVPPTQTMPAPTNDAAAAFGFGDFGGAPLSLTQAFAGTMAGMDTQPAQDAMEVDTEQDSLAFLREVPPTMPELPPTMPTASQDFLVRDSQAEGASQSQNIWDGSNSQKIDLGLSQFPSFSPTQLTQELPEPTQDVSFVHSRSPAGLAPPHSTIDTLILPEPVAESPMVKKKGRLQRGRAVDVEFSDVDEDEQAVDVDAVESDEEFEVSKNAFDVLKRAAKKPARAADNFDKKKSEAKDMVQEQAEESEDEYAGLGGASDDESGGEMDEEVAKMIDDEGEVHVDERKLAAFYADKERAADEKAIEKLYKDISNGALRRKRGAEFDLSDDEDDAAERRRRKQREFARMRKALLADENIGKIAENPKKLAFLRAIEDRDDDEDEMDFLHDTPPAALEKEDSSEIPDSQVDQPANPLKRRLPSEEDKENNTDITSVRPPPHQRRTAAHSTTIPRKPLTLAEVRESVSFLIDEPTTIVPDSQFSASEDEGDDNNEEANAEAPTASAHHDRASETPAPRFKLPGPPRRAPIVDRLSLARATAQGTVTSSPGTDPLAFHAPTTTNVKGPGFRVPSLVRRATSNLSSASNGSASSSRRSSGTNTPVGAVEVEVRRGGGKTSNIHYQAREAERRKVLQEVERKRVEGLRRKVGAGVRRSVLGALGGGAGGFE